MTQSMILVMTCGACPEQYDVMVESEQVGYIRLRHGEMRVHVPNYGGPQIFEASPNGDGEFDDDERGYYLRCALQAIDDHRRNIKESPYVGANMYGRDLPEPEQEVTFQ